LQPPSTDREENLPGDRQRLTRVSLHHGFGPFFTFHERAMVDTITNAVETMFTNRHVAGPPRYIIQSTVRRALRDIDAGPAPLRRFNGVRTVAGA
jgi:hypothetical protein